MKKNLFNILTMISLATSLSASSGGREKTDVASGEQAVSVNVQYNSDVDLKLYGGVEGNRVFLRESQLIIERLVSLFREVRDGSSSRQGFFDAVLNMTGATRKKIAVSTHSGDCEQYGQRRIPQTPDGPARIFSHTPMRTYPLMHANTIKWLGQHIPKNFKQWGTTTEIPLGKTAKAVVQFLDLSVYQKYGILSNEELVRLLGEGNIGPAITRYMSSERHKDNVFRRYTNLVRINIIRDVKEDLPIERVIFIPVDSGCNFANASVYILHPLAYPGLTNWFEKEVESYFNDALYLESQKVEDKRLAIAKFIYHFAVFMPYARGSAAIGEWITRALYQTHGLPVPYEPVFSHADQLAQSSFCFDDFWKKYKIAQCIIKLDISFDDFMGMITLK